MELRQLTDEELLSRLGALAAQEREDTANLVEHLAELDRRGIVADTGCATLHDYCTRVLKCSDAAAFLRIRAARAARKTPRVIEDLRSGAIHLDAVMRLFPFMTEDGGEKLLDLASGASKREVLSLVASLSHQKPPERDIIRVVAAEPQSSDPEVIPPPSRVRFTFTADGEFQGMLDQLKSLRRHRFPEGRLEDILKESVAGSLARLVPVAPIRAIAPKRAAAAPARKRSRWVPKSIKAEVWARDGGRCVFVSSAGIRCGSSEFLEYDHIVPWAVGGKTEASNLRLLCRPHNQRRAVKRSGPRP